MAAAKTKLTLKNGLPNKAELIIGFTNIGKSPIKTNLIADRIAFRSKNAKIFEVNLHGYSNNTYASLTVNPNSTFRANIKLTDASIVKLLADKNISRMIWSMALSEIIVNLYPKET